MAQLSKCESESAENFRFIKPLSLVNETALLALGERGAGLYGSRRPRRAVLVDSLLPRFCRRRAKGGERGQGWYEMGKYDFRAHNFEISSELVGLELQDEENGQSILLDES